jgi:hypothetical protein
VRKRLFLFSLVLLLIVSSSAWAAVPQEEAIANTSTPTVGELPILRESSPLYWLKQSS